MGCGASAMKDASTLVNLHEHFFKILILGAKGVGKTAFARRLILNRFNHLASSNRVHMSVLTMKIGGTYVNMKLWDCPGSEAVDMTDKIYSDVDGVVLMYSVTDRSSFERAKVLQQKLNYFFPVEGNPAAASVPVLLLANKAVETEDEIEESCEDRVSIEETRTFAIRCNVYEWDEVSVRFDRNVFGAFRTLVRGVVKNFDSKQKNIKFMRKEGSSINLLSKEQDVLLERSVSRNVIQDSIFGVSLDRVVLSEDGLPQCIGSLLEFLTSRGPETPHIFKVQGGESERLHLKRKIDSGFIDLRFYQDVYAAANVLLEYLKLLPESIVPHEHQDALFELVENDFDQGRKRKLVGEYLRRHLSVRAFRLLSSIIGLLRVIGDHDGTTRMDHHQLAFLFFQYFFHPHEKEDERNAWEIGQLAGHALEYIVVYSESMFDG